MATSNPPIRIEGLRELNRKLRQVGDDSQDMPALMQRLGNIVITNAHPPTASGLLRSTLRGGRGRTKAVVRAGYKSRAGYAPVVHFGWPARGIRAQPFLTDALRRSQTKIVAEVEVGLDQILRKRNLR